MDPEDDWPGEAKIAGVAQEIVDEEEVKRAQRRGRRQRAEPLCSGSTSPRPRPSASTTRKTKLLIEVWTPERGVRTIER